jgi:uncharacterized protein
MPKLSLFPKETRFFAYFQQQAGNIVNMAQQLKDMVYIWQNIKERADVLADMEQDGDAITHDIMALLQRSFIPPLDREDISALAHSLDDIADLIHAAADTLYLYQVECPNNRAKELCDIILKAVTEVEAGVSGININMSQPDLMKRCGAISEIESFGDSVYRAAQVELFDNPNDMADVVKWREVYKKMESTIDACATFAKIMEGIAIKYA